MRRNCDYTRDRENAVIEYIYGELHPLDAAAFEVHLIECEICRQEVAELRGVRAQLAAWTPPPHSDVLVSVPAQRFDGRRWWHEVPAWAQAAAALLCLGIAAGAANLTVQYGQDGLIVRTGWVRQPLVGAEGGRSPSPTAATQPQAPWRGDLAALDRQLRSDFQIAAPATARSAPASPSAEDIMKRVRALVAESERKQERELALRVAEVVRDQQAQRQADLMKIDRNLSLLQNNTGVEVMRQRQLINSLAVRVSQRQ